MAKFVIEIDSENAAFSEGEAAYEISRLIRETADKVEEGYTSGFLTDYNGQRAGHWSLDD